MTRLTLNHDQIDFRLLTEFLEIEPYLAEVIKAADSDKDALGFFPKSVFKEYAQKELLFVLLIKKNLEYIYAGHLLFNARFPKAHVLQMFVLPIFRQQDLATTLLDTLKRHLTELQFISIYARVAEDLLGANRFWDRQNFYIQRKTPGGSTKNRVINVRTHELATPQLFESSGISAADPLGLDLRSDIAKPLFLIDLNVLFDMGPRRPRHEQAVAVFRAERMQACSLAISSEIEVELKRTSLKGKTDPMQALASALPKFPLPPEELLARLLPDLAKLVFPIRANNKDLTANDESDLRHLATAIHHSLPGLVTSDNLVLAAAAELRRCYGIDVISPESFQEDRSDFSQQEAHTTLHAVVLGLEAVSSVHESAIQELLHDLDVDVSSQSTRWAAFDGNSSICSRFIVKLEQKVVGYIVWPHMFISDEVDACLAVSEEISAAPDAVRLMLNHLVTQTTQDGIVRIHLTCPLRQSVVKEVAASLGYTRSSVTPNKLQKVFVNRFVNEKNWAETRELLSKKSGVCLPEMVSNFRHIHQEIPIQRPDKQRAHVSFFKLETILAPVLFSLSGREGVLTPIQAHYAEQLLGYSLQGSLLPSSRTQLLKERHYLCGASLKVFIPGDLIFFYESGRSGAVIAVARILRAYRKDQADMKITDLSASILDSNNLSQIGKSEVKTVVVFDNLMKLPHTVSMAELKSLSCGEPHQLITSRRMTWQQTQGILSRGLR
jgi:predicted nucleic acid-binding protein/GNAT superfamily N-acetyltransferase